VGGIGFCIDVAAKVSLLGMPIIILLHSNNLVSNIHRRQTVTVTVEVGSDAFHVVKPVVLFGCSVFFKVIKL